MAFDAPAPAALRGRRAEHREQVLLLVARHLAAGLDRLEDVFELDDRGDLDVAARAQAAAQQIVRETPLRLVHVLDHQPLARERLVRDEMPAQAFLALERERRLGLLIGRQAVEKLRGRLLHGGGGFLRRDDGARRCSAVTRAAATASLSAVSGSWKPPDCTECYVVHIVHHVHPYLNVTPMPK